MTNKTSSTTVSRDIFSIRMQRNMLLIFSSCLIVSNIALSIRVNTIETKTILVPTIEQELVVSNNFVSEEYLRLRADQVINLLFELRKENQDFITEQLLKNCTSEVRADFKKQLDSLKADIQSKGYYYSYAKNGYEIDNKELIVTINGYLETYLNDKKIDSSFRSYQLSFVNRGGIIKLSSFEELDSKELNSEEKQSE